MGFHFIMSHFPHHHHFFFLKTSQELKINRRGGANKLRGGAQNFRKKIDGGARLFGTQEYLALLIHLTLKIIIQFFRIATGVLNPKDAVG